jgi:hypothetical protein
MLQLGLVTLSSSFSLALLNQIPTDRSKRPHLDCVLYCSSTACLSERISCCNALHDDATTIYSKRFAPCHVWPWIPPGHLSVPFDALLLCWKTRRVARKESLTSPPDRSSNRRISSSEWREQVAQIGEGMAYCGHLPTALISHYPRSIFTSTYSKIPITLGSVL